MIKQIFHFFRNSTTVEKLNLYTDNREWKIIHEIKAEKKETYYACCPEPYPDVTFTFILQRDSPGKDYYQLLDGAAQKNYSKFGEISIFEMPYKNAYSLTSVRSWNFKDGESLKESFLAKNQHATKKKSLKNSYE